ncbi:MAG: Mur ligase [Benniella sp.]|nr:MAG: Mur ligase [Benniella sp.]
MDLGLERVTSLLEALAPNSSLSPPHHSFPIIHVAGTNGKGSICAYLSSILQTAGLRVGRYNSPHLITPRDTIQINNQPISEDDYQYATEAVKQKDAELGLKATSFELLTATAFYWFAYGRIQTGQNNPHRHQGMVDIAVIEVGVGGRLDATNVIPSPKVCVIASIGMDHGALLGNTIEQVAFEKAGIIKPKVPVVIAPQAEGEKVYRVLVEKATSVDLESDQIVMVKAAHWINEAQEPSSPIAETAVGHWATLEDSFKFWIPLLGDFQLENAATAIAAIRVLQKSGGDSNDEGSNSLWRLKITDDAIRQGIKDTVWPGRLQWIKQPNAPQEVNGRMLIDGAHNPPAAIALRTFVEGHIASLQSLSSAMPNGPPRVHWIMAFTKGKDIEEMFDILFSAPSKQGSRSRDTFSAVEFSPPEGMPWVSPIDSQEVCDRLTRQQERVHVQGSDRLVIQGFGMDLKAALKWVGTERDGDDVVVLCGSLYLVADLFRLLAPQ